MFHASRPASEGLEGEHVEEIAEPLARRHPQAGGNLAALAWIERVDSGIDTEALAHRLARRATGPGSRWYRGVVWRLRLVPFALAVLAARGSVACGLGSFECEQAQDCVGGGADTGVCQSDGWCSFPDDGCASGQRYGEHVGAGLAGGCVPEMAGTDGGSDTTSAPATTQGDVTATATTDATVTDATDATVTDATATTTDTTTSTTTTTTTTSSPSDCGDGIIDAGEECDDANAVDSDGCSSLCNLAICGDGIINDGVESCDGDAPQAMSCADYGAGDGPLVCTPDCATSLLECSGCGQDCEPFSGCTDPTLCADGDSCVSTERIPVGTCMPPCQDGSCGIGQVCLAPVVAVEVCAIGCEVDDDCSGGRVCRSIFGELVCMW